jgi:hypothetical protein
VHQAILLAKWLTSVKRRRRIQSRVDTDVGRDRRSGNDPQSSDPDDAMVRVRGHDLPDLVEHHGFGNRFSAAGGVRR